MKGFRRPVVRHFIKMENSLSLYIPLIYLHVAAVSLVGLNGFSMWEFCHTLSGTVYLPLYLRTLITVTHLYLVYVNISLIVYRKSRMLRLRVIFQIAKFDHITPALINLHRLPVMFRVSSIAPFCLQVTTQPKFILH